MVNGYYYFTPNFDPYLNMAVDEWLFDSICRHTVHCRAALRLYSWLFPAITIGYNQDFSEITSKEYLDEQLPVIRRITGGRAIYHEPSEITFSLSAGLDIFPAEARTMSCTTGLISESKVELLF
ncbi:MAG: hypothetical protein NTV06_00355 [candidate division Zixibacteria bacterium]|nr:hypothetical protein [candidate division Zixibacteria bacterium]